MVKKVCSTCKVEKPIEEFTSNKSMPSGFMSYCKDCNNKRNKIYRSNNTNLTRACKRVFSYINRRGRVKSIEVEIDYIFIMNLYESQKGLCAYTKEKLELGSGKHNTLSVDRIDSSLGYLKNNVVLTTWQVNNCKQSLSLKEFRDLCRKIIQNEEN